MAIIIGIICVVFGVIIYSAKEKAKQETITKVASCYWDAPVNNVLAEAINKKYIQNWCFEEKTLYPPEYIQWFIRDDMAWAMWIQDQITRELKAQGYRPSMITKIADYDSKTGEVIPIDVENYYFKGHKMWFEEQQRLIKEGLISEDGVAL